MRSREGGRRIQATDCVLVLLLLLSAVGIGWRAWRGVRPAAAGTETEVRLLWQDTDRRTVECLTVGEVLRTEAGAELGIVTAVEPFAVTRSLRDGGEAVSGTVPDDPRCCAWVTVSVRLVHTDGGALRENGQRLPLGASYLLFGDRVRAVLVVCAVEKRGILRNVHIETIRNARKKREQTVKLRQNNY